MNPCELPPETFDARDEEVRTFRRDGILFPLPVLSDGETSHFRSAYEDFCRQLGSRPSAAQSRNPHLFHRWAYDLATQPRILDAVESIIGPNLLVHHSTLFCKYPHDGSFVSWHQDGYHLNLSEPLLVSAWIALSESNPANGCLRVVRGSHRRGESPTVTRRFRRRACLVQTSRLEIACEVDEREATERRPAPRRNVSPPRQPDSRIKPKPFERAANWFRRAIRGAFRAAMRRPRADRPRARARRRALFPKPGRTALLYLRGSDGRSSRPRRLGCRVPEKTAVCA